MNDPAVNSGGFLPDYENFTLSLLIFLCGKGSIDEKRALEIRAQLNEVFNERAAQYTKRASSSLSSAIAERIYRSVLFCCDVCLRDSGIEKAAEMLAETDMAEIVGMGEKLALECYNNCIPLCHRVYETRLDLPLTEYRNVIKEPDRFIRFYDGRFDALNIVCSIDYPLLYGNELNCCGVMYVYAYYSALLWENEFCGLFKNADIKRLINGYCRVYVCRPDELYMNIAEAVVINALGCIAMGYDNIRLFPDEPKPFDTYAIENKFEYIYRDKLSAEAYGYISRFIPHFRSDMKRHIENNTVGKFIITIDNS